MPEEPQIIEVKLRDEIDETDSTLRVRVEATSNGIAIMPEGYGDMCSPDGRGMPVLIERFNGELRVVIWGDINQEDQTHIISLEGAREELR